MKIEKLKLLVLILFLFLLLFLLVILMVILVNSPGKPKPVTNEEGMKIDGSISEKAYIEINGKKLWFIIKSKDKNNPVLLYLHGGMPDYFLTQQFPTYLEDVFTVVWWDQRGAGMSYDAKFEDRGVTIDDMIEDTRIISEYLKKEFTTDKIFLMAHSGGSYLGIKVIEKYPDLYKAYIGVAQITYQKLSEKKAREYILQSYKNNKSKNKILSILNDNPIILSEPLPDAYIKIRDYAMHDLGIGTMRNMNSIIKDIFIPSLLFKEYSFTDKINLWKGKAYSGISVLWDEIISHDLSEENTSFEIPVYIFHGIYDYTCSFELSKEYFNVIDAPQKKFYVFNESAHSPIFEEPEKCIHIIKNEILNSNLDNAPSRTGNI